MKENYKRYNEILNNYKIFYGIKTLLFYQIGIFYYLFSNNTNDMDIISKICNVPYSKRPRENFYKMWINEIDIHTYAELLNSNDYTIIIFNMNNELCQHNRRKRECKMCGDRATHVFFKMYPTDIDYAIIQKSDIDENVK